MRLQLGGRLPRWVAEFSVLLVLFLLIDGLVLKLVFPKFVDPFWPLHSDFYIPAALAYSPAGFWKVLSYPRPVGYAFFWLIGHLKTRGAMVAVLLLVGVNYSLFVTT